MKPNVNKQQKSKFGVLKLNQLVVELLYRSNMTLLTAESHMGKWISELNLLTAFQGFSMLSFYMHYYETAKRNRA